MGGEQRVNEHMLSVGIAEGLDGTLLQHYWGTIAAPGCGTSKLLLLSSKEVYAELQMQTYLGMHIRSNTLIHVISQMKWFRMPSHCNNRMGDLDKIWKPQAGRPTA